MFYVFNMVLYATVVKVKFTNTGKVAGIGVKTAISFFHTAFMVNAPVGRMLGTQRLPKFFRSIFCQCFTCGFGNNYSKQGRVTTEVFKFFAGCFSYFVF